MVLLGADFVSFNDDCRMLFIHGGPTKSMHLAVPIIEGNIFFIFSPTSLNKLLARVSTHP